jgi:hypothetical protein
MNPPDLPEAVQSALDLVQDQLGPEQFAAAWAAAERRHAQSKRPKAKKGTPDVLSQSRQRLAAAEKKVADILARRAAAAQAHKRLAAIATEVSRGAQRANPVL